MQVSIMARGAPDAGLRLVGAPASEKEDSQYLILSANISPEEANRSEFERELNRTIEKQDAEFAAWKAKRDRLQARFPRLPGIALGGWPYHTRNLRLIARFFERHLPTCEILHLLLELMLSKDTRYQWMYFTSDDLWPHMGILLLIADPWRTVGRQ